MKQNQYSEKHLYYGSDSQRVSLSLVEGKYLDVQKQNSLFFNSSEENVKQALQFRDSQNIAKESQNEEQVKLLIPCVAAQQIQVNQMDQNEIHTDYNQNNNKNILNQILIKTNEKIDNCRTLQGFQSGKRSAIVEDKLSGKFYRLKGCGNQGKIEDKDENIKKQIEQGFILQDCESTEKNTQEVRGCQYQHTVFRELYMTQKIEKILALENILGANKSIGYWKYDQNFTKKFIDLKNLCPSVEKYCGLFETLGEKRIMTHLIQGLNIFLVGIVDQFQSEVEQLDILSYFAKINRVEEKQNFPSKTPVDMDCKSAEEINKLGGLQEILNKNMIFEKKQYDYIDLINIIREKQNLNINENKKIQIKSENFDFIFKLCNISEQYQQIYAQIVSRLINQSCSLDDLLIQISFIYARIGYELGKILRIKFENQVNWGYFKDHHPFIHHCNAHPNNMVVLDPDFNTENLTAPLDYDLSFFKQEFININKEDPTYSKPDSDLFDSYQEQSRMNLELALSGMEIYENFEFSTFDFSKLSQKTQDLFETLHVGNRDTLIIYYMAGFRKENEKIQNIGIEVKGNTLMHDIVKLALVYTADSEC